MQVVIRMWDAEFVEEYLRHVVVVVLSRVDDDFLDLPSILLFDGAAQCCGFDDLRPGSDDGDDFHSVVCLRVIVHVLP